MQENNSISASRPLQGVLEAAQKLATTCSIFQSQQSCLREDEHGLSYPVWCSVHLPNDGHEGLPGGQHEAAIPPHALPLVFRLNLEE